MALWRGNTQTMSLWQQSSMMITRISAWVSALRMAVQDDQKRDIGLTLISVCLPIGSISKDDWTSFLTDYNTALNTFKPDNINIVGMDGNASIGTEDNSNVCGSLDLIVPEGECTISLHSANKQQQLHIIKRHLTQHETTFAQNYYTSLIISSSRGTKLMLLQMS
eukprot:14712313-Ditylum_brightwellii.AAC.1